MVNQQNALRTAAAHGLGGAPLILSHHARLQMPSSVTTTIAGTPSAAHVTAAGLINGSLGMKNIFQKRATLMYEHTYICIIFNLGVLQVLCKFKLCPQKCKEHIEKH